MEQGDPDEGEGNGCGTLGLGGAPLGGVGLWETDGTFLEGTGLGSAVAGE